jgi:hypothetical protein
MNFRWSVDLCHGGVPYIVGGLGHAHALAGNRQEATRSVQKLDLSETIGRRKTAAFA